MAYKTILTVVTDQRDLSRLDAAADLAIYEDGHLEVLCLGINPIEAGYFFPGGTAYAFQETLAQAIDDASALEAAVRKKLELRPELRWSVESAATHSGGLSSLVGLRARFSDLTVLPQPYGENASFAGEMVTEAALFEGGSPVLILTQDIAPVMPPRRVLVAWNQSVEALTSIRRALPLLKSAESVEITIIDPRRGGVERSDPGGSLAQMLIRHGVKAEIAVLARTEPTISDELNRRAIETDADLLVMGAYGHSRLREAILGGATRNMLEKASIPVFMAR